MLFDELSSELDKNREAADQKVVLERGVPPIAETVVELIEPMPTHHEAKTFASKMGRYFDARIRLNLFTGFTFLVAVVLLAVTGFGELYYGNPAFGSWEDYFALLAWGFGSEASRASITDMVKGWGLRSE